MISARHPEIRDSSRRAFAWPSFALLLLVAGLAGCRHKVVAVKFPHVSHAPVDLAPLPEPAQSPRIATLPLPQLEIISVALPAPARRRPAAPSKEEAQPTAQPNEPAPAEFAIGSLSSGDEETPQTQQQAQEMIASILKRIAALPARTADAKKRQIRQVRNFLDHAQQALNTGDAQGAIILATKAGLLMDDLEKK